MELEEAVAALSLEEGGLLNDIRTGSPEVQAKAASSFRNLLEYEDTQIIKLIDADLVSLFVNFLSYHDHQTLQHEAASALASIAHLPDQASIVIQQGAMPLLVGLLQSPHYELRAQAVLTMGALAAHSVECRDLILQTVLPSLLAIVRNREEKLSVTRGLAWILSILCSNKLQPPPSFHLLQPTLSPLALLIHSTDEQVLADACWALFYLSKDNAQAVLEHGFARRLVELLLHPDRSIQLPDLKIIGNISAGNELHRQILINVGVFNCLPTLLVSRSRDIRKDAYRIISNITAGNKHQIQAVLDSNVIPQFVQYFSSMEIDINKEIATVFRNITSNGSLKQIQFLIKQGCIKPLCGLLDLDNTDIILASLESLQNILKVGVNQGDAAILEKIVLLQNHNNSSINNKAKEILRLYYH